MQWALFCCWSVRLRSESTTSVRQVGLEWNGSGTHSQPLSGRQRRRSVSVCLWRAARIERANGRTASAQTKRESCSLAPFHRPGRKCCWPAARRLCLAACLPRRTDEHEHIGRPPVRGPRAPSSTFPISCFTEFLQRRAIEGGTRRAQSIIRKCRRKSPRRRWGARSAC